MKKYKISKTLLVMLCVIVLLSVSNITGLAKTFKVGFSMVMLDAPYFVEMKKVAEEEAKKLDIDLIILDARGKIDKQLSDVEDLISQNCDLIMIDPVDTISPRTCVKSANEANIPVMIFNDLIELTPDIKVVTTFVEDAFATSKLAGKYAAKLMGTNKYNIVLMNGLPGAQSEWRRKHGALEGILEYQLEKYNSSYVNILSQGWGNWSYDLALSSMEDILSAFPDIPIDVVIAENDTMALGALKAIEEAGRLDELKFLAACADGQKEALEAMVEGQYQGKYVCSGRNWPGYMMKEGLNIAMQILNGKTDWPEFTYPEPELITKDNVKQYYDSKAGF